MGIVLEARGRSKQDGDKFSALRRDGLQPRLRALEAAGIKPESAEIAQVPKSSLEVDVETGKKIVKMLDARTTTRTCKLIHERESYGGDDGGGIRSASLHVEGGVSATPHLRGRLARSNP